MVDLTLDGEFVYDDTTASGSFAAEFVGSENLNLGGHTYTIEEIVEMAGGEWRVEHMGYSYAYAGDPGQVWSGSVDVDGWGSFEYAFEGDYDFSLCDDEFVEGTLVLTGAERITFTFDGATHCDRCVPWETDTGASGESCWD